VLKSSQFPEHGASAERHEPRRSPHAGVERGVPLAQVRDLLGHASIVTTERYDNQRLEMLQAGVARLEDGTDFDAGTDATDKVSRVFQDPAAPSLADGSDSSKETFRTN
jgi:hypothetical protein